MMIGGFPCAIVSSLRLFGRKSRKCQRTQAITDLISGSRARAAIPEAWPLVDMLPKDQAADIVYVLRGLIPLIPDDVVEA
jgi:hypothetical protein